MGTATDEDEDEDEDDAVTVTVAALSVFFLMSKYLKIRLELSRMYLFLRFFKLSTLACVLLMVSLAFFSSSFFLKEPLFNFSCNLLQFSVALFSLVSSSAKPFMMLRCVLSSVTMFWFLTSFTFFDLKLDIF